jgi:hypothetical protein
MTILHGEHRAFNFMLKSFKGSSIVTRAAVPKTAHKLKENRHRARSA